MIAAYFPSWASPWVSDASKMDLALVANNYPGLNCVNIAFAQPDMTYTKGSFNGTGLQFSQDFSVVVDAISILKSKGVTVMLSVGGGAYWSTTKTTNVSDWIKLAHDLGCDGIDVDWEVGFREAHVLTDTIVALYKFDSSLYISFAGFSTGAYGADGDTYKGMSIDALTYAGSLVDWVNIMTYDAGPNYDSLGALDCYRIYYKGILNIGFEVGTQSWGGYLLTMADVVKMATYSVANSSSNGVFLWSIGKSGVPSVSEIVSTCVGIVKSGVPAHGNTGRGGTVGIEPVPTPSISITCPTCKSVYLKQ